MLYAAGVKDRDAMKNSPHVGVASVWWEGNPCKCVQRKSYIAESCTNPDLKHAL